MRQTARLFPLIVLRTPDSVSNFLRTPEHDTSLQGYNSLVGDVDACKHRSDAMTAAEEPFLARRRG